jgi:hypothetical protein
MGLAEVVPEQGLPALLALNVENRRYRTHYQCRGDRQEGRLKNDELDQHAKNQNPRCCIPGSRPLVDCRNYIERGRVAPRSLAPLFVHNRW